MTAILSGSLPSAHAGAPQAVNHPLMLRAKTTARTCKYLGVETAMEPPPQLSIVLPGQRHVRCRRRINRWLAPSALGCFSRHSAPTLLLLATGCAGRHLARNLRPVGRIFLPLGLYSAEAACGEWPLCGRHLVTVTDRSWPTADRLTCITGLDPLPAAVTGGFRHA